MSFSVKNINPSSRHPFLFHFSMVETTNFNKHYSQCDRHSKLSDIKKSVANDDGFPILIFFTSLENTTKFKKFPHVMNHNIAKSDVGF